MSSISRITLKLCILLVALTVVSWAQFATIIRENHVDTNIDASIVQNALQRSKNTGKPAEQIPILVKVTDNTKSFEQIESLAGATMGSYLGENVYIVNARADTIESLKKQEDIIAIGQYKAQHKLSSKNFDALYLGGDHRKQHNGVYGVGNAEISLDQLGIDTTKAPLNKRRAALTEEPVLIDIMLESSVPLERKSQRSVSIQEKQESIRAALSEQGISVNIVKASDSKMTMRVLTKDAKRAAEAVASLNAVHWIEPRPTLTTFNKEARWITQSNSRTNGAPLFASGITGQGQIVAVGDTGIDYYGCYFYDPAVNVTLSRAPQTTVVDSGHRKISTYWALIDGLDSKGGHGTHVSGSVLGNAVNGNTALSEFNGMAPDARVFVTDIGCSQANGCTCGGVACECDLMSRGRCSASSNAVWLPLDLNDGYFPYAYAAGARIHTNSWGGGSDMGYSIMTREIDTFAWEHKDFLILFAAGNAGSDYGYVSISSQAEAKNILTVGASMSSFDNFLLSKKELTDYDKLTASYGDLLAVYMGCSADRSDPCNKNLPTLEFCWFVGNLTSEADCCSKAGSFCAGSFSCGCSYLGLGDLCCKQCVVQKLEAQRNSLAYGAENIAYFSSRGPSVDGRIKPDIVAPGHTVLSALSRNTAAVDVCEITSATQTPDMKRHLLQMSGTSMATPVTAGNAALVRQYYADGFHFSGTRTPSAGFNPSSALVKATLINSGEKLQGYLPEGGAIIPLVTSNSSDFNLNTRWFEGFGRVKLDNTLMLTGSAFRLLIGRRGQASTVDPEINTAEVHSYCVTVRSSTSALKATLVWTDYPSTPASRVHLVNDIDLAVLDTSSNLVYAGNIAAPFPNSRDMINTVEQIHLPNAHSGTYKFVVRGSRVPRGPQPYALVITGDVEWSLAQCPDSDVLNGTTYLVASPATSPAPTVNPSPTTSPTTGDGTDKSNQLLMPILFAILVGVIIACAFLGFIFYKVVRGQQQGGSAIAVLSTATSGSTALTSPVSGGHTRLHDEDNN